MTYRIPTHPGAILREDVLPELGFNPHPACRSRVTLGRVIPEHSAIYPKLALRLESVGLSTALLRRAMQSAPDLAIATKKGMPALKPLVVT